MVDIFIVQITLVNFSPVHGLLIHSLFYIIRQREEIIPSKGREGVQIISD